MRFQPVRENPDLSVHLDPPGLWESVAVCCRWWSSERGRRDWPHAAVVAPLRTPEGLDELVRNLLANPQIKVLLVVGPDSIVGQPATRAMKEFFVYDGVGLRGNGASLAHLGDDLQARPLDLERARWVLFAMESDQARVFIRDYGLFTMPGTDPDLGSAIVDDRGILREALDRPVPEPIVLPPPPPRADAPAPHGDPGERVVADTLAELWPAVLRAAMRFGRVVPTQYGNTRELLNLVAVIRDPSWVLLLGEKEPHPVLDLTAGEALDYYANNLIAHVPPSGAPYVYGSRLRGHPSGVDQLERVDLLLTTSLETRAAFATPWRPGEDAGLESGTPCLVGILFRHEEESGLHLTAVFRSHDLYAAYPKNLAALCMLLVDQASKLGVRVGTLTCVSSSAHVYERQWDKAMEKGDAHPFRGLQLDRRSNWRVERVETLDERTGKPVVKLRAIAMHPDQTGRKVAVIEASTCAAMRRKVADSGLVTSIEAALWLGAEIQAMEDQPVRLEPRTQEPSFQERAQPKCTCNVRLWSGTHLPDCPLGFVTGKRYGSWDGVPDDVLTRERYLERHGVLPPVCQACGYPLYDAFRQQCYKCAVPPETVVDEVRRAEQETQAWLEAKRGREGGDGS